jgi:hypothetical protein
MSIYLEANGTLLQVLKISMPHATSPHFDFAVYLSTTLGSRKWIEICIKDVLGDHVGGVLHLSFRLVEVLSAATQL